MQEQNQNGQSNIKKVSKDQMKCSKNIMINFEKTLQQKIENMFVVDGLKKLVKRGKRFGLLTTRFYMIQQDKLLYYKAKTNKKPKGVLNLRDPSLKIEIEYGKIIKEKQFGIQVQGVQTNCLFWLISSNQEENVMLFKYLKLLNGQFQIKQLPLSSNRQKTVFNTSIQNNNSQLSCFDVNDNMISEERINQVDELNASLNLALRNIDNNSNVRKDMTNIEDNQTSNAFQSSPFYMSHNKIQRKEYFGNENDLENRIDFMLDDVVVEDFQRSNARSIASNDIQSKIAHKKSDRFIYKKSDHENDQIEEEERFQNKECGSINYHNSSTYFGNNTGIMFNKKEFAQSEGVNQNDSFQFFQNQMNKCQSVRDEHHQYIDLNKDVFDESQQKMYPYTAVSLDFNKNPSGNNISPNKQNFNYYSPSKNPIYGIGFDEQFYLKGIGDITLPTAKDGQNNEDIDEEYINYYGVYNYNYQDMQQGSSNTLNTKNFSKKQYADNNIDQNSIDKNKSYNNITSSRIAHTNKSNFSNTNSNLDNNLPIKYPSIQNLNKLSNNTKQFYAYNPKSHKGDNDEIQGIHENDDFMIQLNYFKEQGKRIEESIKTHEVMLTQCKAMYEQVKKSMTCIDDEQGQENKVINLTHRDIHLKVNISDNTNKKEKQSPQLRNNEKIQHKISSQLNPNTKNQQNQQYPAHNYSKSETNINNFIDNYYENLNKIDEKDLKLALELTKDYSKAQTARQLQKNDFDNKESLDSDLSSPLFDGAQIKNMKMNNPDENIIEDSEDENYEQKSKRQKCRNMDIMSNYNQQHRSQTDLAMEMGDEYDDQYDNDSDESDLSEKPNDQSSRNNRFAQIKKINYQSGLSTKITNSQTSEKIFQSETQKYINKEMKEMCNSDSSAKKTEETDCRMLDEIKDQVGRSSLQLNIQNPFTFGNQPKIRRCQSSVNQPFNNLAYKQRCSEKNLFNAEEYIYDEYDDEEKDNSIISNINKISDDRREVQNNTPSIQNQVYQDSIIDSSRQAYKQGNQSIYSSQSQSPGKTHKSPTLSLRENKHIQQSPEKDKMRSLQYSQADEINQNSYSSYQYFSPTKNGVSKGYENSSDRKKVNEIDIYIFNEQEKRKQDQILQTKEVTSMVWRNFIREAQNAIEQLRQRFSKKKFLIEIVNLEIDMLIISFGGQIDQLNSICDKIDSILKMIKVEQKQKQNFYDLCLCEINQAELYLVKGFIQYLLNKKL